MSFHIILPKQNKVSSFLFCEKGSNKFLLTDFLFALTKDRNGWRYRNIKRNIRIQDKIKNSKKMGKKKKKRRNNYEYKNDNVKNNYINIKYKKFIILLAEKMLYICCHEETFL